MDQEKIGKFISQLRKEKNMNQEQLAEKLCISRQAISKWELGKALPDGFNLQKLGEIFEVTINELLAGEHLNKENENYIVNYQLNIYEDRNKKKILLRKIIAFTILLVIIFLVYYFVNSYNSFKVFTISGTNNNNITIENGIFVISKEKIYFQLGTILSDEEIKSLRLYYKGKDNNTYNIYSCEECKEISLIDTIGYDEYFNYNELKTIINNMKLDIMVGDNIKTVKLKLKKDFSNNKFFLPKKIKISADKRNNTINYELINDIKNNLTKMDDGYVLETTINSKVISATLLDNIFYIERKNENILENFSYQLQFDFLSYEKYIDNNLECSLIINLKNNTCESEYDLCKEKDNVIINYNQTLNNLIK